MRKFILVVMIALSINTVKAQHTPTVFAAPFASLSNKTMSYGLEFGVCYTKTWISASYAYTPDGYGNYVAANLYNKIFNVKKASMWLYNSLSMDMNTKYIVYSPGISVVYEVTTALSPQFTFSIPVVKSTVPVYTVSFMYNF